VPTVKPNDVQPAAKLVVPPDQPGRALLEFVSAYLINESKVSLRRLIASGRVRVNGAAAGTGRIVLSGDEVSLPPGLVLSAPPAQEMAVQVLYEDADHLCANKPAGVPVLPGRTGQGAGFYRSLVALLNRSAPPGGPFARPHVVHRLDRDTSGVLLVAKTLEAGRALSRQFERRQVRKEYIGLIEGVLPRPALTLDIPLSRAPGSALKMQPDERSGKPARTEVAVRERFAHFCLLEIRPVTGRQHQIRVHLSAIGYPLAVDHLYGRRDELTGAGLNAIVGKNAARAGERLLWRVPLHAAALWYRHPRTGEPMSHRAPLPGDLESFLDLLRRADAAVC
jgi:23S rRNA pseudouridine1911/1915/1917 synthase